MDDVIEKTAEQLQVGDVWVSVDGKIRTVTQVDTFGNNISVHFDDEHWETMPPSLKLRIQRR